MPDVLNPRYSYGAGKLISEVIAFNKKNSLKKLLFLDHIMYMDQIWEWNM